MVYFICLLCAAIHAIGYELVDNGYRISILPWLQNWGILMIAIAYCRQYATCVTIGHRYTFAVLA
ncbi:hypothetical protein CQA67_29500 [Klebsiella pneumoniae]|nr:hypothetical protein CQA67_29500 [Klebsiella pneumoniae]